MLPQYERLESTRLWLRIPFGKFALIVVSLPFFSFIFCVIWSLLYFFERSTGTHCNVRNYLPSISAAIGNYQPQRFIWQSAILLQALPRLLVTQQYLKHYQLIVRKNRRPIAYVACLFNFVENLALVGLSLWTSSDAYEIHKFCFIIFIATSECYMLITYFINANGRKVADKMTRVERKSLKFKRNLFVINVISFAFAGYFFMRHNTSCEPGVYTLFAFTEYLVVLTNMAFHMTAYWDFSDKSVVFDAINGFYMTSSYSYI